MPTKTRNELKVFFKKNAIPTESDFADLIDSQLNLNDDGISKAANGPLTVTGPSGDAGFKLKRKDVTETLQMWVVGPRRENGIDYLASGNIDMPGRMHISGGEFLYLLNKNGVIIGKEYGGDGCLRVQGNLTVDGELMVRGQYPLLTSDQGRSIELGKGWPGAVTPFIDFHFHDQKLETDQDYNVRVINGSDKTLTIAGHSENSNPLRVEVRGGIYAESLSISGPINYANEKVLFSQDQGGSIELGSGWLDKAKSNTPYIDFHFDWANRTSVDKDYDYNVRLINRADALLEVCSKNQQGTCTLSIIGKIVVTGQGSSIKQEGGISATLGAGWSGAVLYYKDSSGIVHLSGLAGSLTENSVPLIKLPTNYTPTNRIGLGPLIWFIAATSNEPMLARISISMVGEVVVQKPFPFGPNAWISLDGISFRADW